MEAEIAWAAGFFDGEGSVFVNHIKRAKGGNGRYYPVISVTATVVQTNPAPIYRFHAAICGVGRINGPFKGRKANYKPYWRWSTEGRPSVCSVLSMLWPYLSYPKRQQAIKVWKELELLKTKKSPKLPSLPEDRMSKGWFACDLDRTLAYYDKYRGSDHIGEPIKPMVERVNRWLAEGKDIRIFTARAFLDSDATVRDKESHLAAHVAIENFCMENFGRRLPITCDKDLYCLRIYDDIAYQVEANTGRLIGESDI